MSAVSSVRRLSPRQVLVLSQSSDPEAAGARDRLVHVFDRQLRQMSSTACRRACLHPQEQDDVLGETYEQILDPTIARFSPKRGKPRQYFHGLVKNGARKVTAQIRGRRRQGSPKVLRGDVWLNVATGSDISGAVSGRNDDTQSEPAAATETRDAADFILAKAPAQIQQALKLLYWEGWSLSRAALFLGTNRFALSREINSFFIRMLEPLGAA